MHAAKDKSNKALYSILATSFINDYKEAASNYPVQEVIRIIGLIKKADLQSKGIESPSLSPGTILNELVSKIIR